MSIELRGRKVWGTGYSYEGKNYGDVDWKEKILDLVKDQDTIIVEGRYGPKNLDMDYNIKGYPFSVISKEDFLAKLESVKVGYTDDVYLYDAFDNTTEIYAHRDKYPICAKNRYIFIGHTATECQMF